MDSSCHIKAKLSRDVWPTLTVKMDAKKKQRPACFELGGYLPSRLAVGEDAEAVCGASLTGWEAWAWNRASSVDGARGGLSEPE